MANSLVVNELLAFLQQKLDVMDEVSAIQICSTNFSQDDIAVARRLLYEVLDKSGDMVKHRREGTKKDLEDIIKQLKVTDPDDVPTFVSRDLNKLPPVTFDIVTLKASLVDVQKMLDKSENTVTGLRKKLTELRNSVAVSRSPTSPAATSSNVNMRRGAALDLSFASAVLSSTPRPNTTHAETAPCTVPASAPAPAPAPAALHLATNDI